MAGPYPLYWAYPSCVHPTFATEASEVFYRLVLFRVTKPPLLEDTLMRDLLYTDTRPADHIRRIDVEIYCNSNGRNHCKAVLAKVVQPVANLTCIKHMKGLQVRLVLDCDCRMSEVNKFEELLAPTIHMLKANGVHVTWHKFDPYGGEPDKLKVPSRDFSCTLEELKAGIQANTVFNASGY
ncbi:hypothetical protein FB567DRAFT_597220 [Paraphoma chrysanthemicola]|uniref:Uncharacterized protein n=1 Tax=Paraphoma chrysanthemicola TaxID=798071 RepID=A0A8K0VU23_9PLEO|nr:hypothetical protein FB567DRAFT_597220 [Paraphoma chrysanthemicola]